MRDISGSTVNIQKKRSRKDTSLFRGFDALFNPSGDGHCQFEAVAFAVGITDRLILRHRVIQYLGSQTETLRSKMLTENQGDYLIRMSQDGTFSDAVSLQSAADLLQMQILVFSSLQNENTVATPNGDNIYLT